MNRLLYFAFTVILTLRDAHLLIVKRRNTSETRQQFNRKRFINIRSKL